MDQGGGNAAQEISPPPLRDAVKKKLPIRITRFYILLNLISSKVLKLLF